jgi:hypothetical protein
MVGTFGTAIRRSLDEVYDGQRTGRFKISQLAKVEQTYIGTKVEIVIQDAFGIDGGGSRRMDYLIAGNEVDCKWSKSKGKWMIPREALGQLCLVVWADDALSVFSVGLVRANEEHLKSGRNQDGKRYLSADGLAAIEWLADEASLPENLLLHISDEDREAILTQTSGQARMTELFRRVQGRIVSRSVVLTVGKELDAPNRARKARIPLAREGIGVLGGQDPEHKRIAVAYGLPIPRKGEWISYWKGFPEEIGQ